MAKRGGWNKKKNMVYFIFLVSLNPLVSNSAEDTYK